MRYQTTANIMMVRPANFGFNVETASSNAFQKNSSKYSPDQIRELAIKEFDNFVKNLKLAGVNVIVAIDTPNPKRPDAVFPNNWITFHQEGLIITYPMYAPLRRKERRLAVINHILSSGFKATTRNRMEFNEKRNRFIEGTGSIIFDHINKLAYACLSPRTDESLLKDVCNMLDYQAVVFNSTDSNNQQIYHTNVMMAMGETFVVICMASIKDAREREMLEAKFKEKKKEIIDISMDQMNQFAGNMLQIRNINGETLLVMSQTAFNSLNEKQIAKIKSHTQIFNADINTIETYGGGSARCMMAEIFLPMY
jgi:hypothetical protein